MLTFINKDKDTILCRALSKTMMMDIHIMPGKNEIIDELKEATAIIANHVLRLDSERATWALAYDFNSFCLDSIMDNDAFANVEYPLPDGHSFSCTYLVDEVREYDIVPEYYSTVFHVIIKTARFNTCYSYLTTEVVRILHRFANEASLEDKRHFFLISYGLELKHNFRKFLLLHS